MDDRYPIPELLQGLFGKFFADRGYVSHKLAHQLLEDFGIQFFAKPRRNMRSRHAGVSPACAIDLLKNKLMTLHDKLLSRSSSIIETINDQLKNISRSRTLSSSIAKRRASRSPVNFCVNVLCALIAYCHQPKKPSLHLDWLLSQSH